MDLRLKEEQRLIEEAAKRFFELEAPLDALRGVGATGQSIPLWRATDKVGFLRMRLPETAGGSGASLFDAALVCEAAGRRLAPVPLADGMAAARLLHGLRNTIADSLLADFGDTPLTLGEHGRGNRLTAGGGRIVLDRNGAGDAVVIAGDASERFDAAVSERNILMAAWLIGAADEALALAARYANERKQFGRPIGSFQAVAHPLADSFCDIEAGRLLVWRAIWSLAEGRRDAGATFAMAEWWARTISRRAVRRALRTFGGYGLTTEYDIHLYFLAINHYALLDGDPDDLPVLIGDRLWGDRQVALPDAGAAGIEMGIGEKAEAFAREAHRFFERELTPDLLRKRHHSTDGHDSGFHRKLAAADLAYPDWPRCWGGSERSALEVTALGRVFEAHRWSRISIGITNMGARMVMQFGSAELQAEVLPRLADGSALSCLGFTEPESGSDMFAARTRAVRDGVDWIITGQKMFTTGAHISDYVLLLTRTSPSQTKHRGITIFFVPMHLPGIAIQPVHTLQDERTNITFYDNVRVPDRYRLGEIDGGLDVMAAAMSIEHGGEGYHILHRSLLEAALAWAFAREDGTRPIDKPSTRAKLARVAAHVELADLLCRRAVWATEAGCATRATGPMSKLFATEMYMADAADLLALTAPRSLFPASPSLAEIESKHRQSISQTIYGGTSEVHRGVVAQFGLNLPRSS